jgi:uncharacterized protein with ATP-grasp and redox domains
VRTYLDCVPCFIQQAIDSARRATESPAVHEQLLRETLAVAAEMPFDQPPPVMGQLIHRRIRELTGIRDPYHAAKQQANAFAIRLYPDLKRRIERAGDPFALAVSLAMAGNIIDLGVKSHLAEDEVHSAIAEALDATPNQSAVDDLRQAVASAHTILYLADNAGEIVFDRLLIEQMPLSKVTVAVKGSPIINDATIEDAEQAGLTKLVRVIDNGVDIPGTVLEACSATFRREFMAADLVIAKGQGNYETLNECAHTNLFFLLKVKCPMIARDISTNGNGGQSPQHRYRLGQMVIRRMNGCKSCIEGSCRP